MKKLKAIWLIIKSTNYVVIGTDKQLCQTSVFSGIGNTLYKMVDLFNHTYCTVLKDSRHKY